MNNLLGRQVDSNYMVRMYCIRGLGNMANIGGTQVNPLLSLCDVHVVVMYIVFNPLLSLCDVHVVVMYIVFNPLLSV